MSVIVEQARAFCVGAHTAVGQVRKYTFEDYHWHPFGVLEILELAADVDDEMRCGALLHDVEEDTATKNGHIAWIFGTGVASLVSDLTDVSKPEDGNREVRKAIDREHTAKAQPRAKTIKLADLIHNSRNIMECDLKFAKVYMPEKRALLEVLTEGDPTLYAIAKEIVDNYFLENPDVS